MDRKISMGDEIERVLVWNAPWNLFKERLYNYEYFSLCQIRQMQRY